MRTPQTRSEFERNFFLHIQKMKEGKIHFSSAVRSTVESLQRVRYLPNGRIDFQSVDTSARLQVNSHANFSEGSMAELLKTNLNETEDTQSD